MAARLNPGSGRVAIVTGASSGIGAEMAHQLAQMGWRVGLTARRLPALEEVAEKIRKGGGIAQIAVADAADAEATRGAIGHLASVLGPVELMVGNAGYGEPVPGAAFRTEEIDRQLRVNVLGAAHAFEVVLPSMLERGRGQLVGISSLAGYLGLPEGAGYCSSKAALTAMLRCLRTDLGPRGIQVTAVHPGYIRTPMTAGANHPMPFAMDVGPAVSTILRGVAAGRAEISLPRRMAWLVNLGRLVPPAVFASVIGRMRQPQ